VLPRFNRIVVELSKLRDYCLSDTHPRERHKARVFRARLGLRQGDARLLRQALLHAARTRFSNMRLRNADKYGERYVLDFEMTTAGGTAVIRSTWIVLAGQNVLRLTSCYVL